MAMSSAERMRALRARRRQAEIREVRLHLPDARSKRVRSRVAKEVAGLDPSHELDALTWIENVSEFDEHAEG